MSKEKKTVELKDEELGKVSGGSGNGCPKELSYMNLNYCRNCGNKKVVTENSSFIYYGCPFADGQVAMTNTKK